MENEPTRYHLQIVFDQQQVTLDELQNEVTKLISPNPPELALSVAGDALGNHIVEITGTMSAVDKAHAAIDV